MPTHLFCVSIQHYDPSLLRFLLALRAILRSAFAVCVITMPTHLFCVSIQHYDPSLLRFLLALCAILRSAFAVCVITMPTHLFCVSTRRLIHGHGHVTRHIGPGRIAQSLTCLTTGTCLTIDSGVARLISARSHTLVEIVCKIISTAIFLPFTDSRRIFVRCAKYVHKVLVNRFVKLA